jgi:hypothetical protein
VNKEYYSYVELLRPYTDSRLRIALPRAMDRFQTINYVNYKYPTWTIVVMELAY